MHWFITGNLTTISLLLSGALQALAKPLPDLTAEAALSASHAEIERRWSEGQSEAHIYAAHTYREATPAWPILRTTDGHYSYEVDDDGFATSLDARTVQSRTAAPTNSMKEGIKAFFGLSWRKKDVDGTEEGMERMPVLRTMRGTRYRVVG